MHCVVKIAKYIVLLLPAMYRFEISCILYEHDINIREVKKGELTLILTTV